MLTTYTPSKRVTDVYYERVFDDGQFNGFSFPCNAQGELLSALPDSAKANFEFCMNNPERFTRFNKILRRVRSYQDNARGKCECGAEIELWNQYMGACQCQSCGLWYNLFGQELLPPSDWEE